MKEGLITLTSVHTSPDLRYAKIFISVLPENHTGTALALLRKQSKDYTKALKDKLDLKYIPRLNWAVDEKIRYSLEIDEVLRQIKEIDSED